MIKRLADLLGTIFLIVYLSPLIVVLTALIRVMHGSPILFRQVRPGLRGSPFVMYKFRTMTDDKDKNGKPLPDDVRLTPFGRFLRSTSLDELPEFINILKGEMSIVGPRPLLMKYIDRYTPEQNKRHAVKPGLSGWAQINGRNTISWEKKFKLDVWYVENQSFWLDLKIIAITIKKVIFQEGISALGEATMPEYNPTLTQVDYN